MVLLGDSVRLGFSLSLYLYCTTGGGEKATYLTDRVRYVVDRANSAAISGCSALSRLVSSVDRLAALQVYAEIGRAHV